MALAADTAATPAPPPRGGEPVGGLHGPGARPAQTGRGKKAAGCERRGRPTRPPRRRQSLPGSRAPPPGRRPAWHGGCISPVQGVVCAGDERSAERARRAARARRPGRNAHTTVMAMTTLPASAHDRSTVPACRHGRGAGPRADAAPQGLRTVRTARRLSTVGDGTAQASWGPSVLRTNLTACTVPTRCTTPTAPGSPARAAFRPPGVLALVARPGCLPRPPALPCRRDGPASVRVQSVLRSCQAPHRAPVLRLLPRASMARPRC